MAKRQQYDYNVIPDAEYFLRMRYNAPNNANVFGVGGGAGTFMETTQEENPMLYQQQVDRQNQGNNKFLDYMNNNSNMMAGIAGAANNIINTINDPNASNAQKVFGALGIGAASKIWEGDTSKVDNAIKDAQAQMQIGKNNLIQDASSVSGTMNGLKANSIMPRQRINFTPTYYNNWKELKGGKGGFWKNMGTATLQGAANGSIGGPWGAAGGAIAGILGSVSGLFGRKNRYKKAMAKANERMNYMVNAARGFNMEQDFAEKAANQNLINNGMNTQRVLDMANFRAYGGNLFANGGGVIDPDPPSLSFMSDAEKEREMAERARIASRIEENPITEDMLKKAHQDAYYPDRLVDTYPEWLPLIGGDRIGELSENSAWWERILPYAGTVIDWDAALADPNWKNIGSAGVSTALDLLPIIRALKGAYVGAKTAFATSKGIRTGRGLNLVRESKATRKAAIDSYEKAEKNLLLDEINKKLGIGNSARQRAVDRYHDVVQSANKANTPIGGVVRGSATAAENAGKTYLRNLVTTDLLGGIATEGVQSGMDYAAEQGDFSYMDIRDLIPGMDYTPNTILSNNGVHFTYNPSSRTWISEESQNGRRIVVPAEEMQQNLQKGLGKIIEKDTRAYGGGIDLSPNLMALQQQKQDNDHLKALNQPFSLGLGNSFNQKMNMFPDGGGLDDPDPNKGNGFTAETGVPYDSRGYYRYVDGKYYPMTNEEPRDAWDRMIEEGNWVEESGVRLPEIEITATKPIKVPKNLDSDFRPAESVPYPDTADPESVEWIANWLNNRREQLYNNWIENGTMNDVFNHSHNFAKINSNRDINYDISSEVPKNKPTGTEIESNYSNWIPYSVKNTVSKLWRDKSMLQEDLDNLVESQVYNAASASEAVDPYMPNGQLGEYIGGENAFTRLFPVQTEGGHHINYSPNMSDTTPIHERAHAMNAYPQEYAINKIISAGKKNQTEPHSNYWDSGTEVHSRLYQIRKKTKLSPYQKVDKKWLNSHRKELSDYYLDRYDDNTLLRLFNEVADNNNYNYRNVAAYGGPIDPPKESEVPSTTAVRNTTDSLHVDNALSPAQKAILGGATPTDYALAVTKEALDAERAKARQNTQTVINMLYGDRHGEADNGNRYDFGGTMKNLPSEMQSYETGGTHEQNPYGGIQIGTDQQGNPNLVEQGEFRYGDYIFSDRIPVNYDTLFDFGLIASVPKKKPKKGQEKTYADYAKDLVNKTGDPNDPITKRTNDANLQRLANAEEYQKAAKQGQMALDDSLNEYKSALKNGQSPMYGSMKYNGMNGGADPMDASSLTNVSRSGTPMMAAYGGNLFKAGGTPVNRYKITPKVDTLDSLMPIVDRGILGNYTDNTRAFNIIDNNPEWVYADPWQAYNELNKYYDPHEIAALRQSYGMQPQGGVDEAFVKALQTDLKNKGYYKGNIDGDFGPQSRAALDAMNGTWAWTPYNDKATVPTNTQFNGALSKYNSYSTSNSSSTSKGRFAGNDAAQTAVEGMTNIHTTDPNSPQAPVENTGIIPPQTGQMADTTKWQFKKLPTQGKWATLGLNAVQAGADANGFTNPDFTPNFNDANRLERKGEASTFARTNAHIGGYQAPDITDIQSPLAQAIQQQQATNRALQNIGGGRNAAASIIANDYNVGQTMGDIVAKANAQNAANRMAAAEINRGIDQFNAQSDNDMYKDNLNAQIQGQQMNLNATQAANEERLRQMLYQDATNRQAHQNIVTNQNQMYNNALNMIADQAARNEEWNLINSKHNQDFYFDPKTGGWEYKGDSGAYSKLNNALATIYPDMPMTGLSADVQKEWNNLLQSKGGQNITDDEIRWIVDMERNAQIEQKAKREHELKLAELNRANTAKANGGYISNKKRNKYTNYDYNAI